MPLTHKLKQVILDRSTPATVLLVAAVELFGAEVLQWDPETVRMELEEAVAAKIPASTLNKLMVAIELVTTDGFYTDLPTFIRVCNTLYNGTMDLETFDPADAGEIAWGITEALLIWPPDPQEEEPFAQKIVSYIGYALRDEGILQPPDVLQLGILPEDTWAKVQADFADDPLMFRMVHEIERQKTDEINLMVKQRLAHVLNALDELPLQVGDAKDSVKKMLQALKQTEQRSDQMKRISYA